MSSPELASLLITRTTIMALRASNPVVGSTIKRGQPRRGHQESACQAVVVIITNFKNLHLSRVALLTIQEDETWVGSNLRDPRTHQSHMYEQPPQIPQ